MSVIRMLCCLLLVLSAPAFADAVGVVGYVKTVKGEIGRAHV